MIIKALNIYGFGQWIDQQITIQDPLQVVYGPNEAGKSTIIAFIKGILFGFTDKKHSIHGQYQPKGNAPYGGEITFSANQHTYKIVRTGLKYGGTVKFYDLDNDTELTETDYQNLIGPIDRTTYDQLFYFGDVNQSEFYKMGRSELATRIQSIGVAGANDWMGLQDQLDKDSAGIYAPRGRTKEINVQIADYKKLESQVRDARDDFPHYQDLQQQLKESRDQLARLQEQRKTASDELGKNRQLQSLIPVVNQLAQLEGVNESKIRKGFSDDDHTDFNDLKLKLAAQANQLSEKQAEYAKRQAGISKTPGQAFYESHQERIDRLYGQLASQSNLGYQVETAQQQVAEAAKQLTDQSEAVAHNAKGEIPKALSADELNQVNDLLRTQQNLTDQINQSQKRRAHQPEQPQSHTGLIYYGIAGALLVAGVILSLFTSFGWIGFVLVIVAAGAGWYVAKQSQSVTPEAPVVDIDALNRQLSQVQQQLATISEQFGLAGIPEENWIGMQASLSQIATFQQTLLKRQAELNDKQTTYNQFIDQWQFAGDWLKFDRSKPSDALMTITQTVQRWQKLAAAYQQKQAQLATLQTTIQHLKDEQDALSKQKTAFLNDRKVQSDDEFEQVYKAQKRLVDQLKQKHIFEQQLAATKVQIPDQLDAKALDDLVVNQNQQVQTLSEQIDGLTQKVTQLNTEINGLIKNGQYYQLRQDLANKQTEIIDNVQRYVALKLGSQWIQAVLNIASKGRLPKTLTLAKRYFATLTNGAYKDIIFKNEISVVREDDVRFPVNELSTGTMEQLYLALIMSMAVGFSDQYPMPIMIDDGFVNFDQSRRHAANQMLKQVSEQTQVLYFTANLEREFDAGTVLDLGKL
ncbi:AAA family ATPase [Lentilactobacillus parabuchneri]|uniref:ATP-binding protein n=1 Tax=Lentilactobacillus parabuchneri TaxID=152331 RepID=UPI003862B41A